jgi:hypothetical protein
MKIYLPIVFLGLKDLHRWVWFNSLVLVGMSKLSLVHNLLACNCFFWFHWGHFKLFKILVNI